MPRKREERKEVDGSSVSSSDNDSCFETVESEDGLDTMDASEMKSPTLASDESVEFIVGSSKIVCFKKCRVNGIPIRLLL